jgi:hypothetical protein
VSDRIEAALSDPYVIAGELAQAALGNGESIA